MEYYGLKGTGRKRLRACYKLGFTITRKVDLANTRGYKLYLHKELSKDCHIEQVIGRSGRPWDDGYEYNHKPELCVGDFRLQFDFADLLYSAVEYCRDTNDKGKMFTNIKTYQL